MKFQGKIGFCIGEDFVRNKDKGLYERMRTIGSPAMSDGMNKFNTMDPEIKPIVTDCCIAGQAVTLRLRGADNLMLHKCIGLLQEGDVLVIDTCGNRNYCVLGDLIATAAFRQKIAGIIVDGGIRDICELRAARLPIFTRTITPAVGDKDGPGEINRPICCGGIPVLPGDYVVADDNGIVVIPADLVDLAIANAEKKLESDEKRRKQIEAGVLVKPEIDEMLRKKGVLSAETETT